MKEYLFTIQHRKSGQLKQYLFASKEEADKAMSDAKSGNGFFHKAGYTELDWSAYCEGTVGSAQSTFDQLQWFTWSNTTAQSKGQHQAQKQLADEWEASPAGQAARA